jgi:hypothetical protein
MAQSVIKLTQVSNTMNLGQFHNKQMFCPVTAKNEKVFAIPLELIEEEVNNPGRINGTDHANANQIYDDLITNPKGQVEPICVKFNKATGMFRLIYGYNRLWAFRKAKQTGYNIDNTNNWEIFARIFTGTKITEITQQMKENGNKLPAKHATKEDMVFQLQRLIGAGGLDDRKNDIPFSSFSDEVQNSTAKKWMQQNVPYWGGRKFNGLWTKYLATGQATANSFKTWIKDDMSDYFLNNNEEGITKNMLQKSKGRNHIKSGDIFTLTKDGKTEKVAVYLSTQDGCYNSQPFLVNISRKKFADEKPDRIITIQSISNANSKNIIRKRKERVKDLTFWHNNLRHVVDKIYWIPQSRDEIKKHYNLGEWAKINNF